MAFDEIDARLGRIEAILQQQRKKVMTADELCEYTGYSKAYLHRMTSGRKIPHYKQGNKLFFNREEIDGWLMQNRVDTVKEIESRAQTHCLLHK